MWLLVMIWNNLYKSISLCLSALSRKGCQSFFTGWNVAVFTLARKLVLWEVEHVIRFTAAGSSETEFGHCKHYLINVMEWSLAFSGCHLKLLTQHIYPLLYILPLSYFLLTTSLIGFCLFYSDISFISPSLPVVCHAVCVCLCSQWSNWSILCLRLAYPLGCYTIHRNEQATEKISHKKHHVHLSLSSSFYKRLRNPLCFDRTILDHDALVKM